MAETKTINTEFIIKGESYYSSLAQPNSKGKFASNCYEVGFKNPEVVCKNSASKEEKKNIKTIVDEYLKETEEGEKFIKIKNSRYPILTLDNSGKKIELPRISNGVKMFAKCKINFSEQFNKDYITVLAVKLIDDYKPFNPFEDLDDFTI